MKLRLLFIFFSLLSIPVVATAQDSPQRDPAALAARYLNITGIEPVITLPEPYEPGVTTSQFWAAKHGDALPRQVNAVLASGSRVSPEMPGVLLWVEEGVDYDEFETQSAARALAAIFAQLALRANYSGVFQLPGGSTAIDPSDLMPVPDVDGDGFIHVLYSRDLADERLFPAGSVMPVRSFT